MSKLEVRHEEASGYVEVDASNALVRVSDNGRGGYIIWINAGGTNIELEARDLDIKLAFYKL